MEKGTFFNRTLFAVSILLLPFTAEASIWLKNNSNYNAKEKNPHAQKSLSVLKGNFPHAEKIKHFDDAEVYIVDMNGKSEKQILQTTPIRFTPLYKGNYYLFFKNKHIQNNTLFVELSKARIYNQTGDIKQALLKEVRGKTVGSHYDMPPFSQIPLEIVMLRPIKQHHINCCLYSSDIARFKLYYRQKPIHDATLKAYTQEGWSKIVSVNKEGIYSFEIPRDKYIDTQKNKRFMESLLIEASYIVPQSGKYHDKNYSNIHYSMTLPLTFHTSPLEYSAKVPAYLTVIGVMLIFSLGIYYYRRQKRKPHKEIWFDEK